MRLKELREEKNLTQYEVARAIKTSQSNIGRWEKGLNEPAANYLILLADFFDVSIDYLLGRSDEFKLQSPPTKKETSAKLTPDGSEKTFIDRLKMLMDEQCNGRQSILAQKAILPKTVISSYFCRGSQPSLSQLVALSKALNCSIDYLAGIEPDIEDSLFPYKPEQKYAITSMEEDDLLNNYRNLPEDLKWRVRKYISDVASIHREEVETKKLFEKK